MKPLKVEFQAFGPYAGYEKVDFLDISSKGLFLICGKTGSGKTMILDAMTFALYGKSSGNMRDDFEALRCTTADDSVSTFVKFEFENNGEYYLFERRLEKKRKNLSATQNAAIKDEYGNWKPLFENPKERLLNEKAEEIIGLKYEQFKQVIVLPQGQFERFLVSNSDEKEKILTSIFGTGKWGIIAENLYQEAEGRKKALDDRINNINVTLREEKCESIDELRQLIKTKSLELEVLNEEYKNKDFENYIKSQQELYALAKSFSDLENAKKHLSDLENDADVRKSWDREIEESNKASYVVEIIKKKEEQKIVLKERQDNLKKAIKSLEKSESILSDSENKLKEVKSDEPRIEEQKKTIHFYEGKREDYGQIDLLEDELNKKLKEEKNAVKELEKAEKSHEELLKKATALREEYNGLIEAHGKLLDRYLSGITGELAKNLVEGKPCPVCGSTSHPSKAVMEEDEESVSKDIVDNKKSEAENAYARLNEVMSLQNEARENINSKRNDLEEKRRDLMAHKAKKDAVFANLIDGIKSSKELENAIKKLIEEVDSYEKKKASLEEALKSASDDVTKKKGHIESAKKEEEDAALQLQRINEELGASLIEHGFTTEEDAKKAYLSTDKSGELINKRAAYDADINKTKEIIEDLGKRLSDKKEAFYEDNISEEICEENIRCATEQKDEYTRNISLLSGEIKRLEKKEKEINHHMSGMEDEIRQAESDLQFAKTLRGNTGTGLQRYVLGIMFSTVIAEANRMLELVHGGRYRIYRTDDKAKGSNKRGLELKVYDKNSENHEGRFVSTLSGGEKFLAALALSIGMSFVAQKSGVRIEALFIDEGFGSLDEESISDAMNILDSIRRANGMVGIISHVGLLQERIPIKLIVNENEQGSHIIQSIG